MKIQALSFLLVAAATLPAQTQTLRGKVEDVRNTQNQYFLDCTSIPLTSTMSLFSTRNDSRQVT